VELVLDLHTVESSSAHVYGESRSRAETLGGLGGSLSSPGRDGRSEARTQGAPCHSERGCVGGDPSF
jgi:hypothetical protein